MASSEIPGTFAPGFEPPPLRSFPVTAPPGPVRNVAAYMMGECKVIRFTDDDGLHLTVSHATRYPTWDEIKTARYRCLPPNRTFALLLPPPGEYVDTAHNPNVFELTEVPQR